MLGLAEGRQAICRDIEGCIHRLGQLDPAAADLPTRLAGWTIRDLARHLTYGQQLQAEGWERARSGVEGPPTVSPPAAQELGELVAALQVQHERFRHQLETVHEDELARPCPMPYGTLPTVAALQVAVMEAGVHHSDLAEALGGDGAHLEPDTLDATFTLLPGSLPQMAASATARPPTGTTIRLAPEGVPALSLRVDGAEWQLVDGEDDAAYVIGGAPAAVALFAFGRIPLTHPALVVDGDAELAKQFKAHFPGP